MKYGVWVLLGLIPTLAAAETTIYGQIKGGISATHQSGGALKYSSDQTPLTNTDPNHHTQIDDYGSYVGLRGQEPLGDTDIKAIWQIEQDTPIGRSQRRH